MSRDMKVELSVPKKSARLATLKLDGEIVPFHSVNIDVNAEQLPFLQIELEVPTLEVEGEQMRVFLHPVTANILKKAGWTGPTANEIGEPTINERLLCALLIQAAGGSIVVPDELVTSSPERLIVFAQTNREERTVTYTTSLPAEETQ